MEKFNKLTDMLHHEIEAIVDSGSLNEYKIEMLGKITDILKDIHTMEHQH